MAELPDPPTTPGRDPARLSQASVRLRGPDGTLGDLGPGEIVGRAWWAALRVLDPRVSEAHAIVSLRGGDLWLLALRRRLRVDGVVVDAVPLVEGERVELASGLAVAVEEVVLPAVVVVLEGEGLEPVPLPPVASLYAEAPPRLAPRYAADADAIVWGDGASWWRSSPGGRAVPVVLDEPFAVQGRRFRLLTLDRRGMASEPTRTDLSLAGPLRFVAHWDNVSVSRAGSTLAVFGGVAARLLYELLALNQPVAWQHVASEVWSKDVDEIRLRRKWDIALVRLRSRFRVAGLRPDLVSSNGVGLVHIALEPGDTVEIREG